MANRKPYPSNVSNEEWAFVAPYLALVREDAPQRNHNLREVFNGLRWIVRTGSAWRYMPHDLPPWEAVYQQTQRWLRAGVFEQMVHDLRVVLRLSAGRASDPTATVLDSRTLRSTPESGSRGGYDGAKRKKGTKVHAAVDPLGHLLALRVSPANEQERKYVGEMARAVQEATGESVELAYVDQGYTGERAAEEAEAIGMRLEVVKHEESKRGFVLLPRRWGAPGAPHVPARGKAKGAGLRGLRARVRLRQGHFARRPLLGAQLLWHRSGGAEDLATRDRVFPLRLLPPLGLRARAHVSQQHHGEDGHA